MRTSAARFLITTLLVLTGCATVSAGEKAADFSPAQMDKVYVWPAIDDRVDTAIKIDFNQKARHAAEHYLKDKQYAVEFVTDPGASAGITGEDLKTGNTTALAKLGPSQAQWVMVFTLEELSRRLTFGSTGNAEITMTIVDRRNKRVVWHDKAVGRAGQGGLLGMAMIARMSDLALDQAFQQIFQRVPAHAAHRWRGRPGANIGG